MNKCLRGLLAAAIVCGPSIDAVRACGRPSSGGAACGPGFVVEVVTGMDEAWGPCSSAPCGCGAELDGCAGDVIVASDAVDAPSCCEEIPHGTPLDVAGPVVAPETAAEEIVPDATGAEAPASVLERVIAPEPAATPSPASAIPPEPVAAPPAVVPAVPPAVPAPAPEPVAPRNLFEDADAEATDTGAVRPEPLRRWIDDTASHAVVGRLLDVQGRTVRILRADGRRIAVPLSRLSGLDRDYVGAAEVRMASARRPGPPATATAGR